MENLTVETFREKICDYSQNNEWEFKGTKPAIIDFYADWCNPCKMIAPILHELSTEYPQIDFYKVNVEEQDELSSIFGIRAIPSILFIPVDGKPQMKKGATTKKGFKEVIQEIFGIDGF